MKLVQKENEFWDFEELGELRVLIPWDYYQKIEEEDDTLIEQDIQQLQNFFKKLDGAEEILLINEPDECVYPIGILLKTPIGLFWYDVYEAMTETIGEEFQYINTKKYGTSFNNKKEFIQYVKNTCENKTFITICAFLRTTHNVERRFIKKSINNKGGK